MMTMERQSQDSFQSFLLEYFNQIGPSDVLQKIRAKAWECFLKIGLPTRQNEVFRYLRLRALFSKNYCPSQPKQISIEQLDPHIFPECKESVLVFVNGHFAPAFSRITALSKKIIAASISDAMQTYSGFLNGQWTKALKEEADPFVILNMALQRDGLFLYLPPKTIEKTPIQLLHLTDADSLPMLICPRMQLFLGFQSELSLISTQAVLSGKGYAVNLVADAVLEEAAHLNYVQSAWGLPEDAWHLDAFRAIQKGSSSLKTVAMTNGAEAVRYDYRVALAAENAEALLNGVWMLGGKNEAHFHVLMDHQAPHCHSMQLFKGVLNESSRSSFEGKIFVRQAAQKTEAYQLNHNLLLSEYAHADSKPNLEIFADDVKASHGSTVGQLDAEQIFYMKTRGYSESAAKNLLISGFCQEVIDMIPMAFLYESMRSRAQKYLRGKDGL